MAELARILRPGGMLLIAVPIVPKGISHIRERQFARELKSGKRKDGHHIHAFWPTRARQLATDAGFQVEFTSGAYLLRKQGSWIENSKVWTRINQFLGACFPALSQEFYMQLRKI